ncbi:flagella basal body P-ring formation protein FlgA [Croceibacterium sp. LX-88]|jgi:flagella basal body P-ring formation protein FlgA|uniref:Flagella basal body P-ring formation protein FlgA n=1 Tax=Croceibacterium selenioxidans TaxID=2838833 RepID=A0ABS5W1S5_9SPHN|nr:flagella basal body P-ring formation protein FlgA [Croceibacterium selenioxidans]MBT2133213.1 flagella basal body P-ring formation protein FlgA [Croceibacterium selenioxidans]
MSAPALAAGVTDLSAIDRAVADFTGAAIGTPGGARLPVDRRLRLAECAPGMALEWYGRTRNTVIVQCPEPGGWRVFVPLVDGGNASASAVAAGPDVVSRGSRVTISVKGSGFTLSRQGEALEAGAVGEWIRVQPLDRKGDPLRAQVLRPGIVGMELP